MSLRTQSFTPMDELKHLCLGGIPDPSIISEELTDNLIAKLAFASSVQFQYAKFEQETPRWLGLLITYLNRELSERFNKK